MKINKSLQSKLLIWAAVVTGILMIPLLGQAPWSLEDYIFAGIVLFGAASGYELITFKLKSQLYRIMVALGALGGVMLIWAWAVA
jgi:hypothetical protein